MLLGCYMASRVSLHGHVALCIAEHSASILETARSLSREASRKLCICQVITNGHYTIRI